MNLSTILKGFTKTIAKLEKYEQQQQNKKNVAKESIASAEASIKEANSEEAKAASIRNKLAELVS